MTDSDIFSRQDFGAEGVDGEFDLTFLISKRAKAISAGSKPLVDFEDASKYPVLAAIEEFHQNKVTLSDMLYNLANVPTPEAVKASEERAAAIAVSQKEKTVEAAAIETESGESVVAEEKNEANLTSSSYSSGGVSDDVIEEDEDV